MTRLFLSRRANLAAVAVLFIAAFGAASSQAADPFVAGGLSSRPAAMSSTAATTAIARARAIGTALGMPGVRQLAHRVDDAFDHRTYDEVMAFDGGGREVAIARFDVDGNPAMLAVLGWRAGGGRPIDGPAAANRAAAAVRAAGLSAPGRATVQASAGGGGWSVAWPRVVGGATVRGDGLRVLLFADGTFHGLTRTERPLAAAPGRPLAERSARDLATQRVQALGASSADLAVVAAERVWVAPNDTLGGSRLDAPGATLRLVWAVRFESRNLLTERLRAVEVWIDAADGSLVGGDVVE